MKHSKFKIQPSVIFAIWLLAVFSAGAQGLKLSPWTTNSTAAAARTGLGVPSLAEATNAAYAAARSVGATNRGGFATNAANAAFATNAATADSATTATSASTAAVATLANSISAAVSNALNDAFLAQTMSPTNPPFYNSVTVSNVGNGPRTVITSSNLTTGDIFGSTVSAILTNSAIVRSPSNTASLFLVGNTNTGGRTFEVQGTPAGVLLNYGANSLAWFDLFGGLSVVSSMANLTSAPSLLIPSNQVASVNPGQLFPAITLAGLGGATPASVALQIANSNLVNAAQVAAQIAASNLVVTVATPTNAGVIMTNDYTLYQLPHSRTYKPPLNFFNTWAAQNGSFGYGGGARVSSVDLAGYTNVLHTMTNMVNGGYAKLGYGFQIDEVEGAFVYDANGNLNYPSNQFPQGMQSVAATCHLLGMPFGLCINFQIATNAPIAGTGGGIRTDNIEQSATNIANWDVDFVYLISDVGGFGDGEVTLQCYKRFIAAYKSTGKSVRVMGGLNGNGGNIIRPWMIEQLGDGLLIPWPNYADSPSTYQEIWKALDGYRSNYLPIIGQNVYPLMSFMGGPSVPGGTSADVQNLWKTRTVNNAIYHGVMDISDLYFGGFNTYEGKANHTNTLMLSVQQDSGCWPPFLATSNNSIQVMSCRLGDWNSGKRAVVFSNRSTNSTQTCSVTWSNLMLLDGTYTVKAWDGTSFTSTTNSLGVSLAKYASELYTIEPASSAATAATTITLTNGLQVEWFPANAITTDASWTKLHTLADSGSPFNAQNGWSATTSGTKWTCLPLAPWAFNYIVVSGYLGCNATASWTNALTWYVSTTTTRAGANTAAAGGAIINATNGANYFRFSFTNDTLAAGTVLTDSYLQIGWQGSTNTTATRTLSGRWYIEYH